MFDATNLHIKFPPLELLSFVNHSLVFPHSQIAEISFDAAFKKGKLEKTKYKRNRLKEENCKYYLRITKSIRLVRFIWRMLETIQILHLFRLKS